MSDPETRRITPSLEAVVHPERFEPFPGIADPAAFQKRWTDRSDWVLANLSHAAYQPAAAIEALSARLGAVVKTFDRDGAQGLLARWPGQAVAPRAWPFRYRHHGHRVDVVDPVTGPKALYDHSIILYHQNLESVGGGS